MNETFAQEIREGLTKRPKSLSSKWLYDAKGSELFRSIMHLEEYYPTDCEFEIFQQNKESMLDIIQQQSKAFNLVEFGAGDGKKTKILLQYFVESGTDFRYTPIDISSDALLQLEKSLKEEIPALRVECICTDYFTALQKLNEQNDLPKVVLFLGSNIGNFMHESAGRFLQEMRSHLREGDMLMIGFDLEKNPRVIEAAYDDKLGVTKAFNMNMLERINREFDANFDLMQFDHYSFYDIEERRMKSYLVSLKQQEVDIKKLDLRISFDAWEYIHTEISQKYRLLDINYLADHSGFDVVEHMMDCKHYFTDSIWKAT